MDILFWVIPSRDLKLGVSRIVMRLRPVPRSVSSPRYAAFRRFLVQARKDAAITQVALAKKLGRPQSYVSKFELGERRLDVVEFLEVAGAIGCDPFAILKRLRVGSGAISRKPKKT